MLIESSNIGFFALRLPISIHKFQLLIVENVKGTYFPPPINVDHYFSVSCGLRYNFLFCSSAASAPFYSCETVFADVLATCCIYRSES